MNNVGRVVVKAIRLFFAKGIVFDSWTKQGLGLLKDFTRMGCCLGGIASL